MPYTSYEYRQFLEQRRTEFVRTLAHRKWDAAGRPEGRDQEFWYQAEQEYDEYVADRMKVDNRERGHMGL